MQVLTNRHRETALLLTSGPVWATVVRMAAGVLHISRMCRDELAAETWRELAEYPIPRAVDHFIHHPGGVSDAARREIDRAFSAWKRAQFF